MNISMKEYSLTGRLQSLHQLHARVEERLREEMRRPLPDALRVQRLKKVRLRTKDEITSIVNLLHGLGRPHAPDAA